MSEKLDAIVARLGAAIIGEDKRTVVLVLAVFARETCDQLGINPDEFIAMFKSKPSPSTKA